MLEHEGEVGGGNFVIVSLVINLSLLGSENLENEDGCDDSEEIQNLLHVDQLLI